MSTDNVARIWSTDVAGSPRTYGVWNKRRGVWMVRGGLSEAEAKLKAKTLNEEGK